MSTSNRPRLPSTLASRLEHVLTAALGRLPLLSHTGARIYEQAAWQARKLEVALSALHESVTAIPAAPDAPLPLEARELAERAAQIGAGAAQVVEEGQAFGRRSDDAGRTLQRLLLGFLQELRALEEMAAHSKQWLDEMDAALAERAEPADGAQECRSRLSLLEAVVRSARKFHALADKVVDTRRALGETVQDQVARAGTALQAGLEQGSRLDAPLAGSALAALVAARSDAQIWVAQALALVLRLQSAQQRLAREDSALRHRCSLVPQTALDATPRSAQPPAPAELLPAPPL